MSLNGGEVDLTESLVDCGLGSSKGLDAYHSPATSATSFDSEGSVDDSSATKLLIVGECTEEEKKALADRSDKPLVVAGWITEEITRASLEGILLVSLVPFPFPFAQMVAALLVVFLLILPMMVLRMTQSTVLSPILSFFCLLGYWGLNEIAVELENPFGDDDNDLPLKQVHTVFVKGIRDCAGDLTGLNDDRHELSTELKKIHEELEALGVPESRYFSEQLGIVDLSRLSKSELRTRFNSAEVAVRVHRRIAELSGGIIFDVLPFVPPTIKHPFAVQIFAIILGYVIVFRTDMALNRYWEGVTNVHLMISKWGDAFMQINSFINVTVRTCSEEEKLTADLTITVLKSHSLFIAYAGKWMAREEYVFTQRGELEDIRGLRTAFKHRSIHPSRAGVAVGRLNEAVKVNQLECFPDKTCIISLWIQEALTRLVVRGLIKEISTGMLGYNQALKVSQVPFPFPFAQMVSLLLLIFLFMCPIMVVKMTEGTVLSPILSFFCLLGYWGLNEIAVELENPFGDDDNDLPLETIHTEFVDSLQTCAVVGPAKPFHHSSLAEMAGEQLKTFKEASLNFPECALASSREKQFSAVIEINNELDKMGIRSLHFGPEVILNDLLLLTLTDLRHRFGPVALRVYRRIQELAAESGVVDVKHLAMVNRFRTHAVR
ncbi:hypothetical protein Pmar_PMAR025120 [Perkinsus marinus ATCC 50983]|uniref:Bestrophin homolog n=1 Tax=Perkinsus marinus (strain ATCC 50983 / TXsc) TaxID=423536 RepID=C5LQH6_PERM5|nr:hypothetical protein Pmar_PMAR025120 [Perkinsus marinus ATCC 50983]EER01022.1 hypothetical protein Pmar_PMAR025120 [Perkinsus marinus ATCC 50983]|eukprot:XP_002768304.1 hypothetical protein Pmar_PMAR025120 [Perkinsus marinus ATCC 50983]